MDGELVEWPPPEGSGQYLNVQMEMGLVVAFQYLKGGLQERWGQSFQQGLL